MPRTILVVSAHAADFVWRAGGAIALYVDDIDLALRTLEDKGLSIVTESDLLLDDDMF